MLRCLWALVLVLQPLTFAATTQPPVQNRGPITRDPECDNTKGCYPGAEECNTTQDNCIYLITWYESDDDHLTFTIRGLADENYWGGIGLSEDQKMGKDNVIVCLHWNETVVAEYSYNTGNANQVTDPNYGITTISGSYADSVLSCEFTLKKSADFITGGNPRDKKRFFDIEEAYYLFVSHGAVQNGKKLKHFPAYPPIISPEKIDFQNVEHPLVPVA